MLIRAGLTIDTTIYIIRYREGGITLDYYEWYIFDYYLGAKLDENAIFEGRLIKKQQKQNRFE